METNLPNHALLGNVEYPLVRSKLRAWLVLEDFYADIIEAAGVGDRERFVSSLYSYISAALSIPIDKLQSYPWYEIAHAFRDIFVVNRPSLDFPILRMRMQKKINEKIGWEYPGRKWFIWLHLLAGKYGWNISYIEELDPDNAIALLQEILVDDQLQREWEWSMSEMAYAYDKNTKTSRFVPLERPDWMKQVQPVEAKKVRVKASELPVGIVLKWDTDDHKYTRPQ